MCPSPSPSQYEAVVMGSSMGGMTALRTVLSALPKSFPVPIIVVQHQAPDASNYLASYLGRHCPIRVSEAIPGDAMTPGNVYLAPPNFHLLIELDRTFTLSLEEQVNYARPSIDVLFECAADTYRNRLIGVLMTGANCDGSVGLKAIKQAGGLTIVEDPETAHTRSMPDAALALATPDYVLPLSEIAPTLLTLLRCD